MRTSVLGCEAQRFDGSFLCGHKPRGPILAEEEFRELEIHHGHLDKRLDIVGIKRQRLLKTSLRPREVFGGRPPMEPRRSAKEEVERVGSRRSFGAARLRAHKLDGKLIREPR